MIKQPKTLLRFAWAMFYAGLIGVGMAGLGITGYGIILIIMLVYTVVMRPPQHWVGLRLFPATMLVLSLASGVLWAVGLGLAMLLSPPSPEVGVGVALAGIALARTIWSPEKEAELARQLDAEIARAEAGIEEAIATPDPRLQRLEDFLAEVRIAARRPGGDPADYAEDVAALVAAGLMPQALVALAQVDGDLALGLQLEVIAHPDAAPDGGDVFRITGAVLDMDDTAADRALTLAEGWLDQSPVPDGAAAALERGLAGLSWGHPLRARAEALVLRVGGTVPRRDQDDDAGDTA